MTFLVCLQATSDVFILGHNSSILWFCLSLAVEVLLVCIWLTDGGKERALHMEGSNGPGLEVEGALCPHSTGQNSNTWPHLTAKKAGG